MRLETQTHTWNARGPRLEVTVRTCTVHANLGPWIPGPWIPGPWVPGPRVPGPWVH